MLPFADTSVLERQKSRFKSQQEQQQQHQIQEDNSFGELGRVFQFQQIQQTFNGDLGEVVLRSVKPDPGLLNNSCWNSGLINGSSGFDINFALSRTTSCPPTVATAVDVAVLAKAKDSVASEKSKRKSAGKAENHRDKRVKVCEEDGESVAKVTDKNNSKSINRNSKNSNKDNSGETSKDNSKVTEVQKPDYIHVRARRGQATDSHSLAERMRREKISERMKYLQDLVPGCSKITGKPGKLDEIINYVQSLQRQVEFLSMKLAAAANLRLDFNIDNFIEKETFPPCPTNFPAIGMSSDMTNSAAYLQYNPIQQQQDQQQQQQLFMCCGLDIGINDPVDVGLRRTISAPVSIPESYMDSSLFNQMQPSSTWDADLENLYNVALDQGRSTSFPTQPFTGTIDASNLKMEM